MTARFFLQILHLADAAAENKRNQAAAASELSCGTRLLNTLIRYWAKMTDAEFLALQSAICPVVSDNGEQVFTYFLFLGHCLPHHTKCLDW